jgi:hypothetical protein
MMQEASPSKPESGSGKGFARVFKNLGKFFVPSIRIKLRCNVKLTVADIYPKIDESYRVQTSGGALCKTLHLCLCNRPFCNCAIVTM